MGSAVDPICGSQRRLDAALPRRFLSRNLKSLYKSVLVDRSCRPMERRYEHDLPTPVSRTAAAWDDLVEGMSKSWMWSAMAMQDIRMRYRGSLLGPFWLTISMVIMIAAMGLIYARMFNMEITTLPAVSDGRPGDLELRVDGDHRRLPDLPLGPKRHHASAHAVLGSRLAHGVPQPDRVGAQHGDHPIGADHLQVPVGWTRHLHRAGARHPDDQRRLGEHSPGNDQRALSRRSRPS